MLNPPDVVANDNGDSAMAFTILMNLSSALNLAMIIVSIVVYAQYCCCINDETRLKFTANFGYLVFVCAIMVILVIMALFACILLIIQLTFKDSILIANIVILAASCLPMYDCGKGFWGRP